MISVSQTTLQRDHARRSHRPVVAHVVRTFPALSETFIQATVANVRNFDSVVLAEDGDDRQTSAGPSVYHVSDVNKGSWPWMVNYLDFLMANESEFYEYRTRYRKLINKVGAGLIHAHFAPQGWHMLYCKRALTLPLVTTLYGYDMSRLPSEPGWSERLQELFREGDLFLAEGPHMAQRLAALGCPGEKIREHRIGLDLKKYTFRPRQLAPRGSPVRLLFCGRFTEKKGLEYAVEAVHRLVGHFQRIELRVIGDGPLAPRIKDQARRHGLEGQVRFLGVQPHEEVVTELQRAHILVQPSVTARDGDSEGGAPTILLEAQAVGVPVVATRHADIPNVVEDGKAGILVPERNPTALAEALDRLLTHPEWWPCMGRAGRAYVEAHHNISHLTNQLETYYTHLLNGQA